MAHGGPAGVSVAQAAHLRVARPQRIDRRRALFGPLAVGRLRQVMLDHGIDGQDADAPGPERGRVRRQLKHLHGEDGGHKGERHEEEGQLGQLVDARRLVDIAITSAALFTGESVMLGEGLTWEESIPAQVGAMMGIQSANLAVHGFGSDQAYLRLQMELPRFRRPVAVVSLFIVALFGRNLDTDRPHLGPGLVWLPAEQHGRLASLAALLVPYRTDETVERGVTMTRAVLRATVDLARARGADALIVVPQFGPADQAVLALRRRILDETGLPYVWVELETAWRLPWDRHPNAGAARAIAAAVAARLRVG